MKNKLDTPRSVVSGNALRKRKPTMSIVGNALKRSTEKPTSTIFAGIRTDVLVGDQINERDLNKAVSSNRNTSAKMVKKRSHDKAVVCLLIIVVGFSFNDDNRGIGNLQFCWSAMLEP